MLAINRGFFIILISLLLAGCKVELYSGLSEKEGNEMLAILLDGGIETEKLQDKDKNLTLKVPADDVSKAIKLLKSFGYPREHFSSIGDIFPKDGLISSPTEERARYTYSMSQELSSTLSMIDGVINARVHVVLPQDTDSLTEIAYPSSASVFIKYTPELELAGFIPKVKTLVANSIEGLSLDKIAVSLFPATRINQVGLALQPGDAGEETKGGGGKKVLLFVFVLLSLLGLAGGGAAYWYMKNKKSLKPGFWKFWQKKSDDGLKEIELNMSEQE
ncbi:type III secretion system inner membrane ring lipoprotein SctJ [Candidatus Sororendozoicomonas aggregata]|uniref:type III secretion system inner membrane ring lipoprotein SctJ n=1 Tax=Candidatus Sororendozoicomonas aggregata TaxID=3073239 RepID=UPI002ED11F9F